MDIISFSTDSMLFNVTIFIIGLLALVKGSDWLVEATSQIARLYKVPDIVIGLTLVSIGTSLPELATSVYAAIDHQSEMIIGNVVGSNITNITLILGVGVVIIKVIPSPRYLVHFDMFFLIGIFILLAIFSFFSSINWIGGVVFLVLLAGYVLHLIRHKEVLQEELGDEPAVDGFKKPIIAWIFLVIGLLLITVGAKGMVDNAVWIATKLHWKKSLIAATVIAFGTSVPELAVTITSVLKKQNNIAIGNIIGSCLFNIMLIVGVCAIITPLQPDKEMRWILTPAMVVCGVMLTVFMRTKWRLVRWEGIILLLFYAAFIAYNVIKIG